MNKINIFLYFFSVICRLTSVFCSFFQSQSLITNYELRSPSNRYSRQDSPAQSCQPERSSRKGRSSAPAWGRLVGNLMASVSQGAMIVSPRFTHFPDHVSVSPALVSRPEPEMAFTFCQT